LLFTFAVTIVGGMTDLDDLLGDPAPATTEPPKRKRGRPSNAEREARLAIEAEKGVDAREELPHAARFHKPVSADFIAQVMRMDRKTVVNYLALCPVVEWVNGRGGEQPRYDFRTALPYLVPPKMDMEQYVISLTSSGKQNQIPASFSKLFWDGMNARAKYMREQKHTWADEDVLAVFGKAMSLIRDQSLLWIENLPGRVNISNADYHALRAEVTGLLTSLQTALIEVPAARRTESVAAKTEREMAEMDSPFDGMDAD
jgi:hypothetical protein